MYLIGNFIGLRIKQFFRIINSAGLGALLIIPLIGIFTLYLYKQILNFSPYIFHFSVAIIILTIHTKRKDLIFLFKFKLIGKFILLTEYLTIIIILNIPFIFRNGKAQFVLIELFICIILVFLSSNYLHKIIPKFQIIKKLTSFIPTNAYEWKFGLRKFNFLFTITYLLGFVLLFFAPVTPFFIFYWCTFSGEFYKEIESKEIIQAFINTNRFLNSKICSLLIVVNAIFLPHYMLYLILYFTVDKIAILLFSIIILNLLFLYALLLKYSNLNFQRINSSNVLLITFFLLVSPILPLSLFLEWKLYKKTKWTIQKYLR